MRLTAAGVEMAAEVLRLQLAAPVAAVPAPVQEQEKLISKLSHVSWGAEVLLKILAQRVRCPFRADYLLLLLTLARALNRLSAHAHTAPPVPAPHAHAAGELRAAQPSS
jgi:hypothetical protein